MSNSNTLTQTTNAVSTPAPETKTTKSANLATAFAIVGRLVQADVITYDLDDPNWWQHFEMVTMAIAKVMDEN